MGTIIWLIFTTVAGYFIGHHWFLGSGYQIGTQWYTAEVIGGVIGFVVGCILRFGAGNIGDIGDIGDVLGDVGGFD